MSRRRTRTKDIEMRLLSELMKNSHRSDRELARTLKTSQPTVTRTRTSARVRANNSQMVIPLGEIMRARRHSTLEMFAMQA